MRVLAAGPYVGEFGWEMFAWQPLVRHAFLQGGFDRCLAYTGPNRSWLYRFAETRTLCDIPKREPECLGWTNLAANRTELIALGERVRQAAAVECPGADIQLLSYQGLPSLADPLYGSGAPDLLYADPGVPEDRFFRNDGRRKVVLCVRDRSLADHRNWPYEKWGRLAAGLETCDVVVVGKVERPPEWKMPDSIRDLTNKTTVDDLIALFGQADLAVGGSTGTMHLASRCGCDHLVWGAENSTRFPLSNRYAETNWFGADCQVRTDDAWDPDPETMAGLVGFMLNNRLTPRKARVMLTFDDCTLDHVFAAQELAVRGLRGVFGVVPLRVGQPGFPIWDSLASMKKMGHIVANHSWSHALLGPDPGRRHLWPVGPDGVTADAVRGREALNARGLDGDCYVAPFGTANVAGQHHLEEMRKLFRWVRLTIGAPKGDGWIDTGMHRHFRHDRTGLVGLTVAADVRWPGRVRQRMDECARAKTLCVVAYHGVSHVVGEQQQITWPEFVADMDYLGGLVKAGKVEVVVP